MSSLEKVFREIESLKNIIANEKCDEVKEKFKRLLQDTLEEAKGLAEGAKGLAGDVGNGIKKTFDGFRSEEDMILSDQREMPPSNQSKTVVNPNKKFTTDELERYDGKEGRSAYIAVEGVVYDITANINVWTQGLNSSIIPGTDATPIIARNYGTVRVLRGLPIVGRLLD